ncbi:MAG: serine protease [Actinomycetota bacterium]|jgi:V8-like Glu-specific endopeptidase
MSTGKNGGSTMIEQRPASGLLQDGEDEFGAPVTVPAKPTPAETVMVVEEVVGEGFSETLDGGEGAAEGLHVEASGEGAESSEEYAEASAEQLAAQAAEESAVSDLRGIEGFEEYSGGEGAGEEAAGLLADAGSATEGGEEFLPILAGVASTVLPMLASKVGPALAKGVAARLSPRARAALKRHRVGSGLISVVAKLFETAESMPAESGAEATVDEATVEETTQLLEVIIGTDDRVRITSTTKVPWRRYCALRIEFPSGARYKGSAFLTGSRTAITAGHCVFLKNQGGWARRIEVIPGCNGNQRPYGQAIATSFRSTEGWTKQQKPESDYGAIILPVGAFAGKKLGSFGFGVFSAAELLAQPAVLAGYPGDKPFGELWGMSRKIKTVTATQLIYDIDSMGGQSGSPVYIKRNGKRYVVGIHNYGASSGNSATRVTAPVFVNLQKWTQIGSPTAAAPKPQSQPSNVAARTAC